MLPTALLHRALISLLFKDSGVRALFYCKLQDIRISGIIIPNGNIFKVMWRCEVQGKSRKVKVEEKTKEAKN